MLDKEEIMQIALKLQADRYTKRLDSYQHLIIMLFATLGEHGVNVRMITQGPDELNIIVGVEEKDFEQAIRVLYNSFVKEKNAL